MTSSCGNSQGRSRICCCCRCVARTSVNVVGDLVVRVEPEVPGRLVIRRIQDLVVMVTGGMGVPRREGSGVYQRHPATARRRGALSRAGGFKNDPCGGATWQTTNW